MLGHDPGSGQVVECDKCHKYMGHRMGMLAPPIKGSNPHLCEDCNRIKAWLPDIVKAVVEALRQDRAAR